MTEWSHLGLIRNVRPRTRACEECLKMGDVWVHLRLCLTCGHVGCCDTSKNKHATKHFHRTQHPIMRSFEPGEDLGLVLCGRSDARFLVCPAWRVWTLGCRPPRLVSGQNDAEPANPVEERRPGDGEQDRSPGQLPVGLLKSAEDVGAFRVF